jgi:hypothetical protein
MEEILKRDGEYLAPDILPSVTTFEPSITHTLSTVIPNSGYKYEFNMLIFGPFVILLFFI